MANQGDTSIFTREGLAHWEEDLSRLYTRVKQLSTTDSNFETYLDRHPEFFSEALSLITVHEVNDAAIRLFEADDRKHLIHVLSSASLPGIEHVTRRKIYALASGNRHLTMEFRTESVRGRPLWVLLHISLPREEAASHNVLVMAVEISEIRRTQEERERLLYSERQQKLLAETLRDVTLALASKTETEDVLDEILYQTRRLVPYTAANIALKQDGVLSAVRWKGYDAVGGEDVVRDLKVRTSLSPIDNMCMKNQRPVLLEDTQLHADWLSSFSTGWTRSYLSVPIIVRQKSIGLLRLDADQPGTFTQADADLLIPLANAAGVALENARLYRELRQELERRSEVQRQLEASIREQELLIREVHHRVKNNLAMVASLISIQAVVAGDSEHSDISEILGSLQKRIQSIALIHEKLHRSNDVRFIQFGPYCEELAHNLETSLNSSPSRVRVEVDIDDIMLDIDRAIPLGIIVSELLTNALKYAFPESAAGYIAIRFHKVGSQQLLVVEDNGTGLDTSRMSDGQSLGLTLVRLLSQQLNATLTITGDRGTKVEMRLPAD